MRAARPTLAGIPGLGAFAATLLVAVGGSARGAPSSPPLAPQEVAATGAIGIGAARFWRGDRTTLLEGALAVTAPRGATVELVIRDEQGRELHRESWPVSAPSLGSGTGLRASRVTPFAVALVPGQYVVEASVRSSSGAAVEAERAEVQAFAEEPLVSDLLVSPAIRRLAEGEAPAGAEIVKGPYAILPSVRPTLTAEGAHLDYYVELYRGQSEASAPVELEFAVWPTEGVTPLVRIRRTVEVGPPGASDAGRLDLTGLPPGEYRLVMTAAAGARREHREARFRMASMAEAVAVTGAAGEPEPEARLMERYFAVRSDSAIAALIRAVRLAPPAGTLPSQAEQLTPEGQRRLLARYFERRDPDRATPEHELLEEYLARLEVVERRFAEPEIRRAGVETDRGRIYMKYGPPDATLERPIGANRGSVEVWRYTRRRNLKFVFLDDTGFQNFILVFTNDPNETSIPDWMQRIGDRPLIREIETF